MANQRGEVQVHLGGKPHDLVFTMNTIADIEDLLGQSFERAFDEDIGVREIRAAITAGIWNAERNAQARRKLQRLWTLNRVGSLMELDDMAQLTIAIVTGILRFQGKTEAEIETILAGDDDEDADVDETQEGESGEAEAEAPSGTGKTSSAAPAASASTAKPSGGSPSGSSSTPKPATTST